MLFTDLVGSTELRARLGKAAEALRRKHDRLLIKAVQAHQGHVVKSLGYGLMATFVGAADGVAAAVSIQQAVDRDNRSAGAAARLEVTVGLSAGDVKFEAGDCFGTPVVEAARLCELAGGGQILASEVVRLLAGPGEGHDFRPVGTRELRGLPTPTAIYEVAWTPPMMSSTPLPALLTDIGSIFVARTHELEWLGRLWREAVGGELRLALLAGEPGVGKTRLAAELASEVYEQGATVLAGRCDEGLGVPFQPVVEALRHFIEHSPADALLPRLGRYGGDLVRLVPDLAERLPALPPPLSSDPETERYRLLDAVAAWLAALSSHEPVLLVLDDLQWAAKPTLLLLRHVVRSPEPQRLLVLGTYRDTELGHGHPLVEVLADLRRQEDVARLSLSGLDEAGVTAFVEQTVGHELAEADRALAAAIYEETDGNPFFVREVLRHLRETGAIERRDGQWIIRRIEQLGIPEGVREVVGRRLARVSDEANQTLRVAAVVGTEFELPVVQAAGGLDEEHLLAALEEAIASRLVTEVPGPKPRHRFAHTLVRDTLYSELSGARRVTLHRRVAEAIESIHAGQLDDQLPALAFHWARASAPAAHATRAAEYAARAGDRALAQLAHHEAAGYYRQALELIDIAEAPADENWRTDLLTALGDAMHRAGEPGYRAVLLEAARRAEAAGDADRLARAALAGYRGLWDRSLSVDTERVAVLEAALRARGGQEDLMRARLLAVLAAELMFTADLDRRRRLSDEALAIARHLGDRSTLARVLLSRCAAIWDPAMLGARRSTADELRSLAADLGDPFVKVWASLYSFETAMEAGDVVEADHHLDAARQSASEVERALWWFAAFPRAGRVLLAGQIKQADVLARQALEIGLGTQPLPEVRMTFGIQRFQIRFEEGRLNELVANLAEAAAGTGHPETLAMLTQAYCELGRREDARAAFAALAPSLSELPPDPNWIVTVTRSAAACTYLDDTSVAPLLYDLLLPHAGQVAGQGIVWTGSVAHYLGGLASTLGRFPEAETHFASADATHARIGARTWLARTRLEWARMLLTQRRPDDRGRARDLLGQARDMSRDLGMPNVERDATTLRQ